MSAALWALDPSTCLQQAAGLDWSISLTSGQKYHGYIITEVTWLHHHRSIMPTPGQKYHAYIRTEVSHLHQDESIVLHKVRSIIDTLGHEYHHGRIDGGKFEVTFEGLQYH